MNLEIVEELSLPLLMELEFDQISFDLLETLIFSLMIEMDFYWSLFWCLNCDHGFWIFDDDDLLTCCVYDDRIVVYDLCLYHYGGLDLFYDHDHLLDHDLGDCLCHFDIFVSLESSFSFGPYYPVDFGKEPVDFEMRLVDFGMDPVGFVMDLVGFEIDSVDFGMPIPRLRSLYPADFGKELEGFEMDPIGFVMDLVGFEIDSVDFGMD